MISLHCTWQAAGPGGGRPLAGVAIRDRRALLADARPPLLRCRQVGTVAAFVTGFCPTSDWLRATGTLLSIAEHSALYALFNTTYGEIHASPLHFPPALLRALRAAAGRLVRARRAVTCAPARLRRSHLLPLPCAGGNGVTNFALPSIDPACSSQWGSCVTYCIAVTGIYPTRPS